MTTDLEITALGVAATIVFGASSLVYSRRQTKLANAAEERANNEQVAKQKSEAEVKLVREFIGKFDEVLPNVADVQTKIDKIIEEEFSKLDEITVLNFGLDLESVAPWFKNNILAKEKYHNTKFDFKGLIINHESPYIKPLIDDNCNIKSSFAISAVENISSINDLNVKNISIEIRAYDFPPIFHGFIINSNHLFLGFTELEHNKIQGGLAPYIYVMYNNTSKLNLHYFSMFKSWFNYTWNNSKQKVVINK